MRFIITTILVACLSTIAQAQHEFKFSIGPSSSIDTEARSAFNQFVDTSSYVDSDFSNRTGINIQTSYSYYLRYNLKASFNLLFQQMGFKTMEQIESFDVLYGTEQIYVEGIRKLDLLGIGSSLTYITDYDISFTVGGYSLSSINNNFAVSGSVYYPNNLPLGYYIEDTYEYEMGSTIATFFGIGYEFGDLTFDIIYMPSIDAYPGMSSTSFLFGYSHLIIKK